MHRALKILYMSKEIADGSGFLVIALYWRIVYGLHAVMVYSMMYCKMSVLPSTILYPVKTYGALSASVSSLSIIGTVAEAWMRLRKSNNNDATTKSMMRPVGILMVQSVLLLLLLLLTIHRGVCGGNNSRRCVAQPYVGF